MHMIAADDNWVTPMRQPLSGARDTQNRIGSD